MSTWLYEVGAYVEWLLSKRPEWFEDIAGRAKVIAQTVRSLHIPARPSGAPAWEPGAREALRKCVKPFNEPYLYAEGSTHSYTTYALWLRTMLRLNAAMAWYNLDMRTAGGMFSDPMADEFVRHLLVPSSPYGSDGIYIRPGKQRVLQQALPQVFRHMDRHYAGDMSHVTWPGDLPTVESYMSDHSVECMEEYYQVARRWCSLVHRRADEANGTRMMHDLSRLPYHYYMAHTRAAGRKYGHEEQHFMSCFFNAQSAVMLKYALDKSATKQEVRQACVLVMFLLDVVNLTVSMRIAGAFDRFDIPQFTYYEETHANDFLHELMSCYVNHREFGPTVFVGIPLLIRRLDQEFTPVDMPKSLLREHCTS